MMFEHQIRGMIAISITLAVIPLVVFLMPFLFNPHIPDLSASAADSNNLIVEIVQENGDSAIYFVQPGTTASELFTQAGIKLNIKTNLNLRSGTKIHLVAASAEQNMVIGKMDAEKRLALGLPLDINAASLEDLELVPGIGEGLAGRILAWRKDNNKFEKIEQLTDIYGIKEKKLSKLRRYLYVDEAVSRDLRPAE